MPICLDASVAVKLLTREPDSALASALAGRVVAANDHFIAPSLFRYEVANKVWQKVRRGTIDVATGRTVLRDLDRVQIRYLEASSLATVAWSIAAQLAIPSMYDAHYLAASQLTGAPLWTADRRLANVAADWSGELRLLGRDAPDHV